MSGFTITVPVTDDSDKLTLKHHIGEGSFGEYKITLAARLPEYSPHIMVDGCRKTYSVNIHEITKAVMEKAIELGDLREAGNED